MIKIGPAAGALGLGLLIALALSLHAIVPVKQGSGLVLVFCWTALPGVIVARRLYGTQPSAWLPALLLGPSWGFTATSIVLLAMWVSGIRNPVVLALAPVVPLLAAIPAARLAPHLNLAAFDRRDLAPIFLVLLMVPLVVGRPFARVGEMRPEGKAYRAYFIADFEWAMAVVSEVSKGDVPPKNPFIAGDQMHYYWLADLLSAIEHRVAGRTLSLEAVLLVNETLMVLAFTGFFYFFVRQFVHRPSAAAFACIGAILFSSFEGTNLVYRLWHRGVPWPVIRDVLRNANIDAISNWDYGSLKVDGLHRVLLYQAQHATSWAVSLSALLMVVRARDNGNWRINLLAGTLLAGSLLVSSFIAIMVGSVVAVYQGVTLLAKRNWLGLSLGALAGGIPVGAAALVSLALQYADRSGGRIVYVGNLNPVAAHNAAFGIFLSFGPLLIAAVAGAIVAASRRATHLGATGAMIAVAFFFYFYVDVVDHQHAYAGWRAGHMLFIAFAPLIGYWWQEMWAVGGSARMATIAAACLLAVAAAPMTAIDLYNTQDTDNQRQGPGFKWTEIISPDELQALDWVKTSTPKNALVQVDPVRESGTWAYMPAFGERRMTAGMPISMIPLKKYQEASERVRQVFAASNAGEAAEAATMLHLQYLFVGPRERQAYPNLSQLLDAAPHSFNPVFRNGSVTIYEVAGSGVASN